jgi:nicotinamide riboside transporter PnuC
MLYWITSIASLIGVYLNIQKHVACFYIWCVTNAVWTYADLQHGIYPQAAVQSAYFLMAIWGLCTWHGYRLPFKRKDKQK